MNYGYDQYGYPITRPMPDQLAQLRMQNAMGQFPQMQQAVAPQQQMQTQGGIVWVGSEQEAQNFLMAPNSAVTFFNSNAPEAYIKRTDPSGRPSFEAYTLVKRAEKQQESAQASAGDFITREEFNKFVASLEKAKGKKEKEKEEVKDSE